MKFYKKLCGLIALSFFFLLKIPESKADWEVLPESRHHLYQSYSFFIEQQNMLAYLGNHQYWGTVAANLALLGNNSSEFHPQFVFSFSGNAAMHSNEQGGIFTETLDTRIGFMYEMVFPTPGVAFSVGYFHESGHTVDGTNNPELSPLNLGDNIVRIRLIHDFSKIARVGFTLAPIVHATPDNLALQSTEFVEVFPLNSVKAESKCSPFFSLGIENSLNLQGTISFNSQIGLSWGNHFSDHHTGDLRTILGYYNGNDPRAKFSQFLGTKSEFVYFGIMFGL